MRRRTRHSLFTILLVLGIGLPGMAGIFAVQAKAVEQANIIQFALQGGTTATPTPTLLSLPLPSQTSTGLPFTNPFSAGINLYAFIQAPNGMVSRPYVLLTAVSSILRTGPIEIRGFINSQEFVCTDFPCAVYLEGTSRLVFRAYSSTGESSDEVIASISIIQEAQGYLVKIDSVNQFTSFVDSCSRIWGVEDRADARWDSFVQFPYEINTKKTLHTLASQLILNGIVDVADCPSGGLSIGLDWPTACGLERASSKMIEWQNQYDENIWLASRDQGIPPRIIKTLIEVESQFWPGNSRFYLDEFGLGQINQLGVDVLLRRDSTVYQRVCPTVLSDCTLPYLSLGPSQQALIRGAVISSLDATCPTCPNGLDLNKAKDSVSLIAMLMKANCQQVDQIIKLPYRPDADVDAATATSVAATVVAGGSKPGPTYEDLWRFTLLSYHSGVSCFQVAVNNTREAGLPLVWENLEQELECRGGSDYVNGFMNNLFSFDFYLYQASDVDRSVAAPTIVPTRTAVSTPTVFISTSKIKVQVYIDRNGNGIPEEGEWVDAMSVLLTTSNNLEITQRTQNGVTLFDMTGFTPGIGINVSLPGLYRSENFILPAQGDITITFKFDQPALPTILP